MRTDGDTTTIAAGTASKPRRWRRFIAATGLVGLAAGGATWAYVASLGPLPLAAAREVSTEIVDRNGRLLRAFALADGRWRLAVRSTADVDPRYLDLLLSYEDRRFREHNGVDPRALLRAAWQFAREGRIVSGGSTITMQVARLMEPRSERSLTAKLRQIVRAIQLERELSKDDILGLYLALAPFGGNIEGVRAASLSYFGKEPKRLNLAESALLVALPQSPEMRRPDRRPVAARAARDRVLERVASFGHLLPEDIARAVAEGVPQQRLALPVIAPHLADFIRRDMPQKTFVQTTLDGKIQKLLEVLAADRAAAMDPNISIAILAIDHATGEVVARVGSANYFDTTRAGQVDMTRALRSPGSTLKPFIYGMAFEDGIAHPETLIDDRPQRFGSYAPENFDMSFQGTVTVRRALQMSLNVPAIALLDRVGAARLSARLRQAGGVLVLPKDETPGLAMGLGGVGVTLADLVRLYGGLARGGSTMQLRDVMDEAVTAEPKRLMDEVAAWQVGNVLIGAPPPDNGLHNRIAFKTGTSYGYRDAWAVGYDGALTIGVWVGRPDGVPIPGLVGRVSAAPILFDAFARSGRLPAPLAKAPRGTLIAPTAKLPLPLQRYRGAGELTRLTGEAPLRIQFPLDGSRLELAPGQDGKPAPLSLKVSGGVGPVTVMVNGTPVGEPGTGRQRLVDAPGPGFMRLTVMDARGTADTVVVRIQ